MYGHKTTPVSVVRKPWAAAVAASAIAVAALFSSAVHAAPQNIDDGSLTWGIKQSFRSYITGPIAHGTVSTSGGASQAAGNGVFTFSGGSGTYDDVSKNVNASFAGGIHLRGHEGVGVPAGQFALDMQIQNIRIVINGSSGVLIADVASKSLSSGSIVSYPNVEFAALNLASVTPSVSGSTVTFSNIPATLTAAGAPAFADFYQAGTELDPVSISLTVQAPAAEPTATTAAATATTVASATPTGSAVATQTVPAGSTATPVPTSSTGTAATATPTGGSNITIPAVGDGGLLAGR